MALLHLLPVVWLTVLVQTAIPCPDGSIWETIVDPDVNQAMDDAWVDSQEGTPDEHEEGGWVYQCRDADGGYRYEIERWPPGGVDHINSPDPSPADGCRTVASFHTHPGVSSDDPRSNDNYANDEQSVDDIAFNDEYGVPGVVIFGLGPDPEDTIKDFSHGPERPRKPEWKCPDPPAGRVNGDPHLETFDHHRYDFQSVGDFILVESTVDNLRIHIRYEPNRTSPVFSITEAVAMDVDGSIVELTAIATLIDGETVRGPPPDDPLLLPGGGRVESVDDGRLVTWSDGTELYLSQSLRVLVVRLADGRSGSVGGLLGDFDLNPSNDVRLRSGELLPESAGFEDIHGAFSESWRLRTREESLFTYGTGEGPDTFFIPGYPAEDFSVGDLTPLVREHAEEVCKAAGVTDPSLLDDCVFDVGISGDESYAEAALRTQNRVEVAEPLREPVRREPDPPLIFAAAEGDFEAVRTLLAGGADVNVGRERDGATALLFASQNGHLDVVRLLLSAGAAPDLTSDRGWTPLTLAAQEDHLDVATALLSWGAGVDIAQRDGWTPLHAASSRGHLAMVALLLEAGARLDPTGYRDGVTPLAFAAQEGYPEVARVLIEAGADPELADEDGWTPLLRASQNGHGGVVGVLLTAGVDPDRGLGDGWRPLHAAAARGQLAVVGRLLEAGADPTLTTQDGRTARDVAEQNDHRAVVQLLDDVG
jgi:ankyrin repeat protein